MAGNLVGTAHPTRIDLNTGGFLNGCVGKLMDKMITIIQRKPLIFLYSIGWAVPTN